MSIKSKIENFLQQKIVSDRSVSGGCIADTRLITTADGDKLFLKSHSGSPGMFAKEANSLKELARAGSIRIPEVILADENFLLLEYIDQGSKHGNFFTDFGAQYAEMHRFHNENFGFYEDNYLGSSVQYNLASDSEKKNWVEFYFNKRLLAQYKMTEQNSYCTPELTNGIQKLEKMIAGILKGSEEQPTLLHGDLWGGNYLCDSNNNAVLIDPAVYYGHREADLAMTRMFGGYSPEFYSSYQETYPLPEGWQYRENIYMLYHYLNHLNLFGTSYYSTVMRLINSY